MPDFASANKQTDCNEDLVDVGGSDTRVLSIIMLSKLDQKPYSAVGAVDRNKFGTTFSCRLFMRLVVNCASFIVLPKMIDFCKK